MAGGICGGKKGGGERGFNVSFGRRKKTGVRAKKGAILDRAAERATLRLWGENTLTGRLVRFVPRVKGGPNAFQHRGVHLGGQALSPNQTLFMVSEERERGPKPRTESVNLGKKTAAEAFQESRETVSSAGPEEKKVRWKFFGGLGKVGACHAIGKEKCSVGHESEH